MNKKDGLIMFPFDRMEQNKEKNKIFPKRYSARVSDLLQVNDKRNEFLYNYVTEMMWEGWFGKYNSLWDEIINIWTTNTSRKLQIVVSHQWHNFGVDLEINGAHKFSDYIEDLKKIRLAFQVYFTHEISVIFSRGKSYISTKDKDYLSKHT